MKTKRMSWWLLLGCAMASGGMVLAVAGESDGLPTTAVRLEILKGYYSWSPRERREASQILLSPQYRNDPQVGALLNDMARFDKDPEIRQAAFISLCSWRDLDGRLAYHIARLFKLELEPAIKPKMAQAMTQLRFKTDVINTLITYTFSPDVDYPGYGGYGNGWQNNRWGGGWGGGNRLGADWWESANYRMLLDAINKLTGKHFVPANDTARQVQRWWHLNAVDFQDDDKKLALQLRQNGEPAPMQASVVLQKDKPTDPRLAEMFDRLEKEVPKNEAKDANKQPQPRKEAAKTKALNEDEIE
jgi:hypothetical protein